MYINLNSCTVQRSTTAVHVDVKYRKLFSLGQMHMEDCQPSSWIKGSTSLPELFLSVNSAKPPATKSSPPSTARRRSSRHLLEDSHESRCLFARLPWGCLDQEDAPMEMAMYEPYCHSWTTAPVLWCARFKSSPPSATPAPVRPGLPRTARSLSRWWSPWGWCWTRTRTLRQSLHCLKIKYKI